MLRLTMGMTQGELGQLVGKQRAAINKYEKGSVVNIKQETLMKLAEALGCSVAYLVEKEKTPELRPIKRQDTITTRKEKRILKQYNLLTEQGKKYIEEQLRVAALIYKKQRIENKTKNVKACIGGDPNEKVKS